MDHEIRRRATAFLRDFRQLCGKHSAFLGTDGVLELLIAGRGSVFFSQLCGNRFDAGCTYGHEQISDIDPLVLAG